MKLCKIDQSMESSDHNAAGRPIGRYVLYEAIASGGMASVHFGRMLGPVGFSRTVAIKRLHSEHARDPEFVAMFLDEARLAARVDHPNVVATLDIVTTAGEVFLVMDYVRGEALSGLLRAARAKNVPIPPSVVSSIIAGTLHGLHAAHKATSDRGEPLHIVHRDVSPQNILVGEDGVSRIADFGIAKAASRMQSTRDGQMKGKLAYMAPEQILRHGVDCRTDVYAAGVVLWECLAGRRLHQGGDVGGIMAAVVDSRPEPPSLHAPGLAPEIDRLVLRALSREPAERFATAREMASELERLLPPASQTVVGEWARGSGGDVLARRAARLAAIEATSHGLSAQSSAPPSAPAPRDAVQRSQLPTTPEGMAVSALTIALEDVGSDGSALALPKPPTGSRRRRGLVVLAIAAGAAAGMIGIVRGGVGSVGGPLPRPAASSGTPASAGPSAAVPVPVAVAPAPSAPQDAGKAATASASVAVAASRATPAPAIARQRPPARENPSKDKPGSCDPPFTIDRGQSPDGAPVKRFKPWCL